jgi:hypothetical protein
VLPLWVNSSGEWPLAKTTPLEDRGKLGKLRRAPAKAYELLHFGLDKGIMGVVELLI